MNEPKQISSINDESGEPPEWLNAMLRLAGEADAFNEIEGEAETTSPPFQSRCQEASEVALILAKLSKERQRIGFVPLSFADYIHGLVKVANVRLALVFKRLKINDLSRPSPNDAKAFARLAQQLGVSLREVLIHIRIGFAARIDSAPVPLLLARHRSFAARRGQLEECEVVLGQLESQYDLDNLRELRRTELEVRAAYEGASDSNQKSA
jgi:hypothetical protein